jgi:hypothetical protein
MGEPTLEVVGARLVCPLNLNEMEIVSLPALNLKGGEIPTLATRLEGLDSDSNAAASPTTTNSLKPTKPTTNTG